MIIAPRDELEMGELEISWGYFFCSSVHPWNPLVFPQQNSWWMDVHRYD